MKILCQEMGEYLAFSVTHKLTLGCSRSKTAQPLPLVPFIALSEAQNRIYDIQLTQLVRSCPCVDARNPSGVLKWREFIYVIVCGSWGCHIRFVFLENMKMPSVVSIQILFLFVQKYETQQIDVPDRSCLVVVRLRLASALLLMLKIGRAALVVFCRRSVMKYMVFS